MYKMTVADAVNWLTDREDEWTVYDVVRFIRAENLSDADMAKLLILLARQNLDLGFMQGYQEGRVSV